MPYAIRDPGAQLCSLPSVPVSNLQEGACDIALTLETKLKAIAAYTTQLGFQFGGAQRMRVMLKDFHEAEAKRLGTIGAVESVLSASKIGREKLRMKLSDKSFR